MASNNGGEVVKCHYDVRRAELDLVFDIMTARQNIIAHRQQILDKLSAKYGLRSFQLGSLFDLALAQPTSEDLVPMAKRCISRSSR